MNLTFPTDALVHALGWSLVHALWQGTLAAVLLGFFLTLIPARRGNLRYGLSCLALTAVVVLGAMTGVRSFRGAAVTPPASLTTVAEQIATVVPPAAASLSRAGRAEALVLAANAALPQVVVVWLAGVLLLSLRLTLDWLRVRQWTTRDAREVPPPWSSVVQRLSRAMGLRQVVRVLESAAIEVPSVVGLVRPAILIPASTLTGLRPDQLEMILAHELAHIRRHDFLVNLVQTVVETLLFYHPAVWWISRQVRIERENCCDDLAVATCGNRFEYARALLRLDELRARPVSLAMSAGGGSLIERIRRICGPRGSATGPAVRAVGALAIQLCAVLVIGVLVVSAASRDPHPSDPPAVEASRVETEVLRSGDSEPILDRSEPALDGDEPAAAETPVTEEPEASQAGDAAAALSESVTESHEDSEKPSLEDLILLHSQNVTADDVRQMRRLFPSVRLADIAAMKAVGASAGFVRAMRGAGLAVHNAAEAQGLAALGVTPSYLDELRQAGVEISGAADAQSLRAMAITPEFVRRLARAGFRNLTVKDLCNLGAAGLTGSFVREMSTYRTR